MEHQNTLEQKNRSKSYRSKSSKRRQRVLHTSTADGFEEFFAECPLSREELQAERMLYAADRSPSERMESCVQRIYLSPPGSKFRAARKLDNPIWRKNVFDTWLSLGGIRTGQKDYLGMQGSQTNDPEVHTKALALDYVDEPDDTDVVDFAGLARAFFGCRCLAASGSSPDVVPQAPEVIINFLKYVNKHDALPEYREDINAAIEIAELAKVELVAAKHFSLLAPGDLNIALSVCCGGYYQGLYSNEWNMNDTSPTMRMQEQARTRLAQDLPKLRIESRFLRNEVGMPVEVSKIEHFNDNVRLIGLQPWKIPGASIYEQYETDLTEIHILCESSIASLVFTGMHFEASFYQFTETYWFFDSITRVLPSFYVELMAEHEDE